MRPLDLMFFCFCVVICYQVNLLQANRSRQTRNHRHLDYSYHRNHNHFNYLTTTTAQPSTNEKFNAFGARSDIYSSPNRFPKYITTDKFSNKKKREGDSDSGTTTEAQNIFREAPVSVILAMSNITDPFEFIDNFVVKGHRKSALYERNFIPSSFAVPATCTPQPTTVPIRVPDHSPHDVYFPSCTRMDRCGGCCSHDLLECAPSKSEMVELQVLKTRYLGPPSNRFDSGELVTIELEKHLECECQCRVKASHCQSDIQVYRPNECRCECKNQDEARNCIGDKIWDPNTCSCICREYRECSTGFNFNLNTCMCEAGRPRPGFRSW